MRMDRLSGGLVIYQPEQGQRYTTDDVLVAWLAVREVRENPADIQSFLELGCGLCAVSMSVLWCCRDMRGVGIEIAGERLACARLSLAVNHLDDRFKLINADVRELRLKTRYRCITSSPPYYDFREGPVSPDPDRARVRFETKGCIEDYFQAAAAHADRQTRFITAYPTRFKERVNAAAGAAGFFIRRSIDIIPRAGKPALFTLFSCTNQEPATVIAEELTVRGHDQLLTPEFRAARRMLGYPDKSG
jgi:tRNA1(Val) A37 N6-methylase TrmN6